MPVVALFALPLTTRTVYNALPYERKFAAVKKSVAVFEFGLLKTFTRRSSVSINIRWFTGPQRKGPAIAPSLGKQQALLLLDLFH